MEPTTSLPNGEALEAERKEIQVEEATTNNAETVPSTDSMVEKNQQVTIMEKAVNVIADVVASAARRQDVDVVRKAMRSILVTIFSMAALPETAVGPTAEKENFRYGEYQVTEWMKKLVPAKRVVLLDVPSARDFLKRADYRVRGTVLTPGQFTVTWRLVTSKVRLERKATDALRRDEVQLLAEAAPYAVVGGRVQSRSQETLIYLTSRFDEEANVTIEDWASHFASQIILN